MMTARRHFPLHNNEPELIDNFALPLIRESICSAGVAFKRGRTSSSHLRKQMPFALHVAANEYRNTEIHGNATRKSTSASRNNGFVPLSYVRITATDRIPIVPSA